MVEYFDIVDESDRIVGRAPRAVVHRERKWHRVVYVFVFNSRGELFIQLRSNKKDMEPGVWTCSVSGHLSSRETYKEAAIKETEEEIGVSVKPRPLFFMEYEPYRQHLWIFRAENEGPFRLDHEEVADGRFISMDKLRKEVKENPENFSPEFMEILKRF